MKDQKPLFIFLSKLIGSYVVLVLIYNFLYLDFYLPKNIPDPYTSCLSNFVAYIMRLMGDNVQSMPIPNHPYEGIFMDGKLISYVNEGCNAISIMLIFTAFIIAFSTKWKTTLIYLLLGLFIIQVMNVVRVIWLNYIFHYHPDFSKTAHDYLFPAIIYGTIIILWIIWVKFFVLKNVNSIEHAV